MNVPKKQSERPIKEQIQYCFDCSSDKNLLLADILKLVDDVVNEIEENAKNYIASTDEWEHDMGEYLRDYIIPLFKKTKEETK